MDIISTEEWRPVEILGFEDFYEVSNLGQVRSVDRICVGLGTKPRFNGGRVLRPSRHPLGYVQINLWRDGKSKSIHAHRLVAMSFIPNPANLPMVNHIDGRKANNVWTNLEWVDDHANKQHAINVGRITHYQKLLSPEEVVAIRHLGGTMTQAEIAKLFGVTQTNVSLILLGRTHKAMVKGQ
jgi:hypothetical protein